MAQQDEYRRSGVDYQVLDEIKRKAITLAAATAPLLGAFGGTEFADSRGSSAYVFSVNGSTLALVVEGWEANRSSWRTTRRSRETVS